MDEKHLIVVAGPTAVGKTSFAILLAKEFKCDILSADSRQFFRETNIGTAKPSTEELSQVQHHFIDSLSIHDDYSAGMYEKEALELLGKLYQKSDFAVVVGGSGLYIKALCEGIDDMPVVQAATRKSLNDLAAAKGLEPLLRMLEDKDPEYFNLVDKRNPQRVIRALEIIETSGRTYTSYRQMERSHKKRLFNIIKIGLELPRNILYQRIDDRMDLMISNGLFEEAEQFYHLRALNALQTVGYSEVFGFLNSDYDRDEAVRLLKRNSKRYAKRQLTWFKKDHSIHWFRPDQYEEALQYIYGHL